MSVTVANTTSNLSGKTIVIADGTHTVTGAWTFDRDPSAPFAVTSGSAKVANLDADKLDGLDGADYVLAASGTATSLKINTKLSSASALVAGFCQGRLTLTTATPVTTADVTGATTIYFTPYGGNLLGLYDGSTTWTLYPFTEISLALGTLTSGLPYDVFVYDNSGTPTLEFLAWSSGTARATALTTQNGVLVKTGATTRRYLGTFYTTATTTTEDSFAKRFVWNYYNRVLKPMRVIEATNTWDYTLATFQQARAQTTNQLACVIGVAEVELNASVFAAATNNSALASLSVAIGEDSATTPVAGCIMQPGQCLGATVGGAASLCSAHLRKFPAVGYHFYAWLELSTAAGTTSWMGDVGSTNVQSGIHGTVMG